jgi:hypothetical protein
MNPLPPFYDLSAAGSMAATVCARSAREAATAQAPPPFAATPRAPCPANPAAACKTTRWRRLAGALVGLISGPTLDRTH